MPFAAALGLTKIAMSNVVEAVDERVHPREIGHVDDLDHGKQDRPAAAFLDERARARRPAAQVA